MDETEALLSQLRAVQAPDVSAIPAYGWWILATLLIVILYLVYRSYKNYASRQWQREAHTELLRLRSQVNDTPVAQTLADTSRLARRVLLAARPRTEIASLHGEAWLEMLDQVCHKPLFSTGFGRLLEAGPYQREPTVSSTDLNALFEAMDDLIASAHKRNGVRASR